MAHGEIAVGLRSRPSATGSPSFSAKATISACAPDFQTSSPTMTQRALGFDQQSRGFAARLAASGRTRGPDQEALGGQDLRFDALGFERVVRHGEVDRTAGLGGGDFERAPQQQRQALRAARFPADLGELARDFFLIEAGAQAPRSTSSFHSSLSLSPAVMTRAEPSRLAL